MFRVLARNIHPNKLINHQMRSKNTVSGDDTQSRSLSPNRRRRVAESKPRPTTTWKPTRVRERARNSRVGVVNPLRHSYDPFPDDENK
jgi:hypothetical protein